MDTFSDEGVFQIEHDQSRPDLNWARSDFDRRHRLILSWVWELPFHGSRWAEGWQISGVGTFQSGRPFTITDEDFSGFLYASQNPRPSLAPGMTLDDQTTAGSVTSRVDEYLNRDAFVSSGAQFGTLPRNSVTVPGQQRLDISLAKITQSRRPRDRSSSGSRRTTSPTRRRSAIRSTIWARPTSGRSRGRAAVRGWFSLARS